MPARLMGHSITQVRTKNGKKQDLWDWLPPSVFILAKTLEPVEKVGLSRPMMKKLLKKFECSETTGKLKNIIMNLRAIMADSMPSRVVFSESNLNTFLIGTKNAAKTPFSTPNS